MNREDIIRMALEVDFHRDSKGLYGSHVSDITPLLERFAALVAAHEREACVQIVEREASAYAEPVWAVEIVNDIRARGEK